MKTIDAADLKARLERPDGQWPARTWALFDVREAGESQKGHIPGATFLPRRMLEFRLPELLSAAATPVVLYDDGGDDTRAERAADTMARFGYGDVAVVAGGFAAWVGADGDIATGWNVPSKDFGERVLVTLDVPYLNSDDLNGRLEAGENLGIFDVRTADEFREGSLPVSASAPSFEWALAAGDLAENYDGVVVHCAGRTRSIIGAATARLLGLKNLWALENGTMGWRLSGRELAAGQAKSLPAPSPRSRDAARTRARELAAAEGVRFAGVEAVRELLDARETDQLALFDTRDLAAYRAGHVPNAVWLPGGQACQRTDDFTPRSGGARGVRRRR